MIHSEPGSAAPRQGRARPTYQAIPQHLHDPHIRQIDFRVPKKTRATRRPSALAARGPASHTELSKTIRTVPTYRFYNRIARLLRASSEAALFLMACMQSQWVRSSRTNPTKASPQTGPTAQFGRLDGSAVTVIDIQVEQVTMKWDRSLKASSRVDWNERRDAIVIGFSHGSGFCSFEPTTD